MNFLKISGLVIGTGSVVGGTGTGIYYSLNGKNNKFQGKLVLIKKSGDNSDSTYEVKLLNQIEYENESKTFNLSKNSDEEKYEKVNKIIEISHLLNLEEAKKTLNIIFSSPSTLTEIKTSVESKKIEIEKLFGNDIYENLKNIS